MSPVIELSIVRLTPEAIDNSAISILTSTVMIAGEGIITSSVESSPGIFWDGVPDESSQLFSSFHMPGELPTHVYRSACPLAQIIIKMVSTAKSFGEK